MKSFFLICLLVVLLQLTSRVAAKPHMGHAPHYSKQSNENRSDPRNVSSNVSLEGDDDSEERNHFRRILHDFRRSTGLGLGFRRRRAVRVA
uniref:Secreted protein n=1 Tax=Steinernema glaseri TaxID=37863 RepID=A0A1I7YY80_9BILA